MQNPWYLHTEYSPCAICQFNLTMNFSDLPVADRAVKYVQSCLLEAMFSSVYKESLNNSSFYELIEV